MKTFDIIDSFGKDASEVKYFHAKSNSIAIMDDDENRLFDLTLNPDGSINIIANGTLMLNGEILDSSINVQPKFQNNVEIFRPKYKAT